MKNKIIFILFLSFLISSVYSQWETDVRQTNDPSYSFTSYNNARSIAASGNTVHIVWRDSRTGDYDLFYKRSTDDGTTWSSDINLTNIFGISFSPDIAVSGQTVHVVWAENRDGYKKIWYKRSSNNGTTWSTDTALTNHTGISEHPSIEASGDNVHVTWYDNRTGDQEIYYKHSTDGGINWETDTRLTNSVGYSYGPSIALSGQSIHIVWWDSRTSPFKVYYKRSTNNGANWEADVPLVLSESFQPCITVNNQNVHVVWEDYRNAGVPEIYYKQSSDGGSIWGADTRITTSPDHSEDPSVACDMENVHILWWDQRDGDREIYYKLSTNAGNIWGPDVRQTNVIGTSEGPSIAVSGTFVHIAWYDNRDGNYEIYYKRNPTGNLTGISTINSEIPNSYALSQNYPNPFNPSTKIQFSVPKQAEISINLSDITGRIISSIVQPKQFAAGVYEADFDGSNLATGLYFYSLYADGLIIDTKKMILVK